jgi:hypothetical protein
MPSGNETRKRVAHNLTPSQFLQTLSDTQVWLQIRISPILKRNPDEFICSFTFSLKSCCHENVLFRQSREYTCMGKVFMSLCLQGMSIPIQKLFVQL